MPYLIEQYIDVHGDGLSVDRVGKRAAATLEEARAQAVEMVAEHADGEEQREAASQALTLPEVGGTIILPDGGQIVVRPVESWYELAVMAGFPSDNALYASAAPYGHDQIIDTFNAQQGEE